MATLELEHLSKNFGGVSAISDVTFRVPPGEITGLIGPNGAGKSTVVNLITGLLKLSGGSIRLEGTEIGELYPEEVVKSGIARTFQNIRLLHEATVLDNVLIGFHRHETTPILSAVLGLPASRRSTARRREEAMGLLDRFGIADLAGAHAGALSYGHQRRVEMARAVASGPSVLLLDEPAAGMNDVEAGELGVIFRELAASGTAILLIEHNVGFVADLCRTINVLDAGRIIASGGPDEVLANPDVIAAYLGQEEEVI